MTTHRLTIFELLILLFILVIAAAMVMPLFHGYGCRAGPMARRANCSGNLKQMGVAMLMYSGDYSGSFPLQANGNNFEPLNTAGYLKDSKVYGCPSTAVVATTAANSNYWYGGGGYRDDQLGASQLGLAYDMFENHAKEKRKDWMNVLFMDGHVEGGVPGDSLPFKNSHAVLKPKKDTDNDESN